ncbi:MAG: hemolysin family protein [Oscillospiraceae bacterium]|jgi:putative hemolysin|nr:hemolysin family protein [Oscillospiraceae bacterium]
MQPDPDPDPANLLAQILLLFLLILINAFFAMSEIAVISLNQTKIDRMAADGNKRARRIQKLTESTGRFLSMIQIGVTLAGFLASSSAAQIFVLRIESLLRPILSARFHNILTGTATLLVTLLISYLSLVFGELVPKRVAMKYPERISLKIAGALAFCSVLLRPLVWAVSSGANRVLRLIGIDPHADDETVTEEDIRLMVDEGTEIGVIEKTQNVMINNIFEFDDIDAGDIMTHRTDIVAVEADDALEKVIACAIEEGCSRIPVYEQDIDKIIGIVYVKDLLKFIGRTLPEEQSLRSVMREPQFVPESKSCGELFQQMTAKHIQIAVVVDEYGGTAGLVTLEDVIESIVGNIQDEYDDEEEEICRIDDHTFSLDGATDIEEIETLTGTALPEGEYDTIAGFVIHQLGYLPGESERPVVEYENLRFCVEAVEDKRLARIQVEISKKIAAEDQQRLGETHGKFANRD